MSLLAKLWQFTLKMTDKVFYNKVSEYLIRYVDHILTYRPKGTKFTISSSFDFKENREIIILKFYNSEKTLFSFSLKLKYSDYKLFEFKLFRIIDLNDDHIKDLTDVITKNNLGTSLDVCELLDSYWLNQ